MVDKVGNGYRFVGVNVSNGTAETYHYLVMVKLIFKMNINDRVRFGGLTTKEVTKVGKSS